MLLGEVIATTAEDTVTWGAQLGAVLRTGDVVLLVGELGSGKTCLVRGVAVGLECDAAVPVTSPTYTIRHDYPGRVNLVHVDLYRLPETELDQLGLEEEEGRSVIVVEWAPATVTFGQRLLGVSIRDVEGRYRVIRLELKRGSAAGFEALAPQQ